MLPIPAELRERSRIFREAAKQAQGAIKRELANYALRLAQIAEGIEREGSDAPVEKVEPDERALTQGLSESARRLVRERFSGHRAGVDVQIQIKAWRLRAEELRTTAVQFEVPSAQESLRRAAANYDNMADHAEALLTKRSAEKSGTAG
jgi:hypothetical protein